MSRKRQAEATFNELVDQGVTPEAFLLKVAQGKVKLSKGNRDRYAAAIALLPYRLPRLNSIDATVKSVDYTHEQWIKDMENGDDV